MDIFAGPEYAGAPFVLFGASHLIALSVGLIGVVVVLRTFRGASESAKHKARSTIAIIMWAQECGWHAWWLAHGLWTVQEMLPLHLCTVGVWLGGVMLVTRSEALFSVLYFSSIAGATQALLTPDVGQYGFPHYRFWQTFLSHTLVVAAPLWMVFVEGRRPTFRYLVRAVVVTNLYAAVVFCINLVVGSNFLFVNHKPSTASAMDLMPGWPWYLLILEVLVVVLYTLLYLPWLRRRSDKPDAVRPVRRASGDVGH